MRRLSRDRVRRRAAVIVRGPWCPRSSPRHSRSTSRAASPDTAGDAARGARDDEKCENRHSGGRRRRRGLTERGVIGRFAQLRASRPSTFASLGYAARCATTATATASLKLNRIPLGSPFLNDSADAPVRSVLRPERPAWCDGPELIEGADLQRLSRLHATRDATTATGTASLKLNRDPLGSQFLNDSADAFVHRPPASTSRLVGQAEGEAEDDAALGPPAARDRP